MGLDGRSLMSHEHGPFFSFPRNSLAQFYFFPPSCRDGVSRDGRKGQTSRPWVAIVGAHRRICDANMLDRHVWKHDVLAGHFLQHIRRGWGGGFGGKIVPFEQILKPSSDCSPRSKARTVQRGQWRAGVEVLPV